METVNIITFAFVLKIYADTKDGWFSVAMSALSFIAMMMGILKALGVV